MAIFRTQGDFDWVEDGGILSHHTQSFGGNGRGTEEWDSADRVKEKSWINRYEYEAQLISDICQEHDLTKIIELGSGPGGLANKINSIHPTELNYTLVDKPNAKLQWKELNHKATNFEVIDLNNNFSTETLDEDYDLIIANDFLEHIANVTDCLVQSYNISKDNAKMFVSVPNWRMGHSFQYQGLFDHDNWVHTMYAHGWKVETLYRSKIPCPPLPKLSSEETLPDSFINSWNIYYLANKIKING